MDKCKYPFFENVTAAEADTGLLDELGLKRRMSRYEFRNIEEFEATLRYLVKYHLQVEDGEFLRRPFAPKEMENPDDPLENRDSSFFQRDTELARRVHDVITGDIDGFDIDAIEKIITKIYRDLGADDAKAIGSWKKMRATERNRRDIRTALATSVFGSM